MVRAQAKIFRLDLLQARRNHAQFTYLGRGKSWDCKTVFGREYWMRRYECLLIRGITACQEKNRENERKRLTRSDLRCVSDTCRYISAYIMIKSTSLIFNHKEDELREERKLLSLLQWIYIFIWSYFLAWEIKKTYNRYSTFLHYIEEIRWWRASFYLVQGCRLGGQRGHITLENEP